MEFDEIIKKFCDNKNAEYFILEKEVRSNSVLIAIIPTISTKITLNDIFKLKKLFINESIVCDFAISMTTLYINATY